MLSMQAVAEALMNKQATVASVALTIGTLGERQTSEYTVIANYPGVLAVSIGVADGHDATAAPEYVQFFFSPDHPVSLQQIVPHCSHWRKIPGNPKSSPYLYSCPFTGSTKELQVTFVATLTGDIASSSSHVSRVILQRAVW